MKGLKDRTRYHANEKALDLYAIIDPNEYLASLLHNALDELSPIQRDIIQSRFGIMPYCERLPFELIAKRHHICRQRAAQIYRKALKILKSASTRQLFLRARKLQAY